MGSPLVCQFIGATPDRGKARILQHAVWKALPPLFRAGPGPLPTDRKSGRRNRGGRDGTCPAAVARDLRLTRKLNPRRARHASHVPLRWRRSSRACNSPRRFVGRQALLDPRPRRLPPVELDKGQPAMWQFCRIRTSCTLTARWLPISVHASWRAQVKTRTRFRILSGTGTFGRRSAEAFMRSCHALRSRGKAVPCRRRR